MRATASIALLFIGCLALCLTSCSWAAPGKGWKARAGYKAAAPVILALEKFHNDHGNYPANLGELVPVYLPNARELRVRGKAKPVYSPRAPAPDPLEAYSHFDEFGYRRDGDEYELSFSYTGPGMNHCWYNSKTKSWAAGGYY
jgi:hypothetical protein